MLCSSVVTCDTLLANYLLNLCVYTLVQYVYKNSLFLYRLSLIMKMRSVIQYSVYHLITLSLVVT